MRRALAANDSLPNILGWSAVAVALWAVLVTLYFVAQDVYIWLATEDALGENLTAIFYGVAGILLLVITYRTQRSGARRLPTHIWTVLLAVFLIFVAGEEISWGQRIFGIGTPDIFVEQNVQQEVNIHNLKFFDRHSGIFSQHTALNLFCLGFGVLIPLLNWASAPFRRLLAKMAFPVVPLALVMFFVVGLAHGQTIAKYETHWAHTEIKELIFSVGIFFFGISQFLNYRRPESERS